MYHPVEYISNGVGWNGVREQIPNLVTKADGTKEFQVSDHLASLRVAVTSSTIRETDYDPWGVARTNGTATGAVAGERSTFNAQERDAENSFFDLSDRNYDPETGRFTRPDRLWEKFPDASPYGYCAANPLRLTDPTGMQAHP